MHACVQHVRRTKMAVATRESNHCVLIAVGSTAGARDGESISETDGLPGNFYTSERGVSQPSSGPHASARTGISAGSLVGSKSIVGKNCGGIFICGDGGY